jgi:mRNA interferase RelE/StbE
VYKVIVPKASFKELEKINPENQKLIYSKIQDLEKGIFTSDKALKGKYKGKFRKRAGNYRIVYLKENDILVITLIRIAHRKEVY